MENSRDLNLKLLEMARRIRELREIEGFSYEDMAVKTGISTEEYVRCESGESEALGALFPFARVISMRRLLQKDAVAHAREELRRLERLRQTLMKEASAQMSKAADAHFLLEQTYARAMDFAAKERFGAELCRRILR